MEQGGEIATRLQSIYVFCQSYLLKARLDRDPAKIDRVSAMLGELRDAWATIEQQR
jgi:flagellar protein FliS